MEEKLRQLSAELAKIVGDYYVLTSDADLSLYDSDAETLDLAKPDIVVFPRSTEEVSAIVKAALRHKVPVTPRGAGTGLSGGSTPVYGGISLVLTRMTRILGIDPDEQIAHVEAGISNLAVSKAAEKYGLFFAPDPSSQAVSPVGGNLAENAGGAHCLKHGTTTGHVLGAKFVLPSGDVTTIGGNYRESLGIDLLAIIAGSEGTLGIATEAYLRLIPKPEGAQTLLAYFDSLGAGGQAVSDIIAAGIVPVAMEMIDRLRFGCVEEMLHIGLNLNAGALLIVELDGPVAAIKAQREVVESVVARHKPMETKWAENDAERALLWKARKSAFAALGRLAPNAYSLDGVIPRSRLREAILTIQQIANDNGVVVSNTYHAGDGNLHPALLFDRSNPDDVKRVVVTARQILQACVKLGGALSGEHGIGIEKLQEMSSVFAEEDLKAMLRVKNCFDPFNICNPGKLIPMLKTGDESARRPLLRDQIK